VRFALYAAPQEMIYRGDALFPGGNDYPAEQAGVISIAVRGPNETKLVVEAIVACLSANTGKEDTAARNVHSAPRNDERLGTVTAHLVTNSRVR
jgi:hypothetical protein